jgi:hypothetical protein
MRRFVLAVLLGSLVVPCEPVLAATVRVDYEQDALVYRAAPGERNHLSMTASANRTSQGDTYVTLTVADSVAIEPGLACRRTEPGRPGFVECELFGDARAVVRLGDRNDRARVLPHFDEVLIDGGRGDDVLHGSFEKDTLLGGRGTDGLRGAGGVDRLFARGYGVTRDRTADRLRGGRGSDLLMGSGGRNLIVPGPGVDKVSAGRGRDIVYARDDAIEQIHCGAGEDSGITDGIDYPLACEHHEPYSNASPVPLEFRTAAGDTHASLLIGCREAHPAACEGTVQLELGGSAVSEERPFTFANRHRFVVQLDTTGPMPADGADVVIRIRAPDAGGNPTDERYPVAAMLVGEPFLGAF